MHEGWQRRTRVPRKIRYRDDEWARVVERARACGRPAARYVREVSLGLAPTAPRDGASAELVRELGRVGNTLARLAGTLRDAGNVPQADAVQAALAELLAVVRRLA